MPQCLSLLMLNYHGIPLKLPTNHKSQKYFFRFLHYKALESFYCSANWPPGSSHTWTTYFSTCGDNAPTFSHYINDMIIIPPYKLKETVHPPWRFGDPQCSRQSCDLQLIVVSMSKLPPSPALFLDLLTTQIGLLLCFLLTDQKMSYASLPVR